MISKMIQHNFNVSVLDTATRYIAAAEAELAANPSDSQLRDLVATMREVIEPRNRANPTAFLRSSES